MRHHPRGAQAFCKYLHHKWAAGPVLWDVDICGFMTGRDSRLVG